MTETFDAYRIPGIAGERVEMESLDVGSLACRYPTPTPDLLERTIRDLRAAGRALRDRPVEEVVRVVDAASARLADPGDPIRRRADRLLPAATGYSPEMATLVLDRMAADWRGASLRMLLSAELGDASVLDGFELRGDRRRSRAYGPDLAFHVFAGNVPGVAVTSLIRCLLVKAPVLGKLASGQPVLPVLFAEAVASVDEAVASAMAVTYWPGGAADTEWRVLQAADLVVVYGGDDVAASYRERIPADHRLVLHGPRFSVGLVGADAVDADVDGLADAVARAVATFDQHGCVSPHAIWVEDPDGTVTETFAEALASAFPIVEAELPRGQIEPAEAAAIQQDRGAAEMRGHAMGGVRLFAGPGTRWTVVLDREPVFRPSCLNRFVHIHPIAALEEAVDLLAPQGHQLQSVAIAGREADRTGLAHRLARIGATRVTTFDRLPWPPPDWHHDGRGPLRELIRWVDLEG